jgi:6-phosphogluconate dehydrogenase
MKTAQPQQRYEIGMVGLGVMGRNLLLNMADHGFSVEGYDKDQAKVEALRRESEERGVREMVSLGYLDAYRSAWVPANLIQAQRDFFGAHTYERVDAKGTFHTVWERK